MPPRNRRRLSTPRPSEARPPAPPLSSDILLEIIARSDAVTLFRCATTCKPLRRDILNPAFIRRVCHEPGAIVPPRVLGFLGLGKEKPRPPVAFSLAHPATPAAASFSEKHLAPLLARNGAAKLVDRVVVPLTSRSGLVFLVRGIDESSRRYSMAVYDPLAGKLTDFLSAPDIDLGSGRSTFTHVLLTAADGIGCSFLVVAAEFPSGSRSIKVQTLSADAADGEWSAATSVGHCRSRGSTLQKDSTAVVVGGVIHWLMGGGADANKGLSILTYDVRTATAGSIEIPTAATDGLSVFHRDIDLAASPDGRSLSLLVADKLVISVWVLSSGSGSSTGGGWARHAVIDAEASVRSVMPEVWGSSVADMVCFARSWSLAKSGAVLLQRPFTNMFYFISESDEEGLVLVDVETKEMRKVTMKKNALPYEVDLESRLSAMKTF
ncbi:unnamed protein product [Urochloa decumbens]|uniref:DUF7595 domain-containing protein n=1 Tax=Urochloa decumbens TaxID=240449 RepID=A0ABC8YGY3_9POAL